VIHVPPFRASHTMNLTSRFTSWKTLEDLYDEETGMEESNYLPTKIPSKSKNSLKNPIKKNFNVHSSRMNGNRGNMTEAKKTVIDNTVDTLVDKFFNQISIEKNRCSLEKYKKENDLLSCSLITATTYIPHRRPGYEYYNPTIDAKESTRMMGSKSTRQQRRHIYEDTIYLSNPSLQSSSRSGYLNKTDALKVDRQNLIVAKRLRRVSMSTKPLPRVASVTTKTLASSQRSKFQYQPRTKKKPWVNIRTKGKPHHF